MKKFIIHDNGRKYETIAQFAKDAAEEYAGMRICDGEWGANDSDTVILVEGEDMVMEKFIVDINIKFDVYKAE